MAPKFCEWVDWHINNKSVWAIFSFEIFFQWEWLFGKHSIFFLIRFRKCSLTFHWKWIWQIADKFFSSLGPDTEGGPGRTTRNFVWFAKKVCQREVIFSANRNDFLHSPKIFASTTKLQRFRRLALEAVNFCQARKFFVRWYPSAIRSSNFGTYGLRSERHPMTSCPISWARWIRTEASEALVNRRMTP